MRTNVRHPGALISAGAGVTVSVTAAAGPLRVRRGRVITSCTLARRQNRLEPGLDVNACRVRLGSPSKLLPYVCVKSREIWLFAGHRRYPTLVMAFSLTSARMQSPLSEIDGHDEDWTAPWQVTCPTRLQSPRSSVRRSTGRQPLAAREAACGAGAVPVVVLLRSYPGHLSQPDLAATGRVAPPVAVRCSPSAKICGRLRSRPRQWACRSSPTGSKQGSWPPAWHLRLRLDSLPVRSTGLPSCRTVP